MGEHLSEPLQLGPCLAPARAHSPSSPGSDALTGSTVHQLEWAKGGHLRGRRRQGASLELQPSGNGHGCRPVGAQGVAWSCAASLDLTLSPFAPLQDVGPSFLCAPFSARARCSGAKILAHCCSSLTSPTPGRGGPDIPGLRCGRVAAAGQLAFSSPSLAHPALFPHPCQAAPLPPSTTFLLCTAVCIADTQLGPHPSGIWLGHLSPHPHASP